jgi:CRP-like cAMP-binding protein
VDWLSELPAEDIEKLQSASTTRQYAGGEMVFVPDSEPHELFVLERGLVRIFRLSRDGAETTFGYVAPGEAFGELAVFGDYRRESFAQATRPSRVWRIPGAAFRQLLASRPNLVLAVTRQIGARFKRIESRVEDLVFRDARSRVAHILLELAEDFGREDDGLTVLDIDITQAELATLVGITRQTANGCLRELEHEGLIVRRGRSLALKDSEGLGSISRKTRGS